ncbi:hypothetical protein COO60DRAFT_1461993 [Scenedesmus sp. NREL 46B-D3]|nr:hypothetical protein COO60DRAFT_1461993 [Scenedesmus sp. NREL 46B-D3]
MGEGRFTTLWVSKDTASGQQVVLKLMEPGDSVSYTAGTREAALHAMAGRHANIVPLLDAFEHRTAAGRHACMVLERQGSPLDYVRFAIWRRQHIQDLFQKLASDLDEKLDEKQQDKQELLTARQLLQALDHLHTTARQLLQALDHLHTTFAAAAALDHLHTRGLAHMDLSMDNVLLDKPFLTDLSEASRDSSSYYTRSTLHNATLKLTDFGRAVPFKQLAAQPDALSAEQPDSQLPWGSTKQFKANSDGEVGKREALAYNPDGMIVMADPTLRPPEVWELPPHSMSINKQLAAAAHGEADKSEVTKLTDSVSYTAGTREAALHAMAGRHANIVPLLDVFEHRTAAGRHACMVLERQGSPLDYVSGCTSTGCLGPPPQQGRASRWTCLLTATRTMRGLVHMDLTMDNILIDKPHEAEFQRVKPVVFMWLLSKAVAQHFLGVGLRRLGFKHRADGQKRAEGVSQHKTEASCANDVDDTYHFRNLHTATFKLADFGRAVLFKQLAAEQGTLLAAAPLLQDQQLLTRQVADMTMHEATVMQLAELMGARPAPYILDGEVTLTDPCLRPPERRIDNPQSRYHKDDALLLMEMQPWLGMLPRTFARSSPRFKELYQPNDLLRLTNAFELKPTSVSIPAQIEKYCMIRRIDVDMSETASLVLNLGAADASLVNHHQSQLVQCMCASIS